MIFLRALLLVCGAVAHASPLERSTKEYLPPFKPDDSPGLTYPDSAPPQQNNYPAFAPTKDIYIPPVRLPLTNEVYEPINSLSYGIRPINQSPVVNSANFPPYFQTTSMDLVYPKDPYYSSNIGGNNYYAVQSQYLYKPKNPTSDKGTIFPSRYPDAHKFQQNRLPPVVSQPVVPDFATPPTATTFPPPTFKPFIIRDPSFGLSADSRRKLKIK